MMHVIIVDDEQNMRGQIKSYLGRFASEQGQKIRVIEYEDPIAFLQNVVSMDIKTH